MKNQSEYLSKSLDRIFLSTEKLGFWDDKNSRIHSRLDCTTDWKWKYNPDPSDRYGVFTISMILLAKFQHGLDISSYESKILAYLNYIKDEILAYKKSNITYGAFNALVLGQLLFEKQGCDFKNEIRSSYQLLENEIPFISNNEDSLALIGLSLYYKKINKDKNVLKYVNNLVESLLSSQNEKGFFLTGDIRGVYVGGVREGGAGAAAGLKEGDVILEIEGVKVSSASELQEIIVRYRPGDEVNLKYMRGGKTMSAKTALKNKLGTTKLIEKSENSVVEFLGAEFISLSDNEKAKYKVRSGVKVLKVGEGTLREKNYLFSHNVLIPYKKHHHTK